MFTIKTFNLFYILWCTKSINLPSADLFKNVLLSVNILFRLWSYIIVYRQPINVLELRTILFSDLHTAFSFFLLVLCTDIVLHFDKNSIKI
jgi:hypothetical protein